MLNFEKLLVNFVDVSASHASSNCLRMRVWLVGGKQDLQEDYLFKGATGKMTVYSIFPFVCSFEKDGYLFQKRSEKKDRNVYQFKPLLLPLVWWTTTLIQFC